jgi:transcriptional regulator NrdR family protein
MVMICEKCGKGEMRSASTRISKRTGFLTRTRKCHNKECGNKYTTIEIKYDSYKKNNDLVDGLQKLVTVYMASE